MWRSLTSYFYNRVFRLEKKEGRFCLWAWICKLILLLFEAARWRSAKKSPALPRAGAALKVPSATARWRSAKSPQRYRALAQR